MQAEDSIAELKNNDAFYLFIDESGDHGLINIDNNFPVFVLCGVVISNTSYRKLVDDITKLKYKFWDNKKVIFHSRNIRKCDKEFQILLDYQVKSEFYNCINRVIKNNNYAIISSILDKNLYIRKYGKLSDNVYQISLSFVIERTIFFLDDNSQENNKLKIIIEKRGKKEDKVLNDYLNKFFQRGSAYVSKERIKKHKIEVEFIDKKDNSIGLQLSDLLAYPIARYAIDNERANPAFDILYDKIYKKGNKLLGLKTFP